MSKRQQRVALTEIAKNLRKITDDIEASGTPGRFGLLRPDKIAAVDAIIEAGVAMFDTGARILRLGKPTQEEMKAAEGLDSTADLWRASLNEKNIAGPSESKMLQG